jgi:hypothetical protein
MLEISSYIIENADKTSLSTDYFYLGCFFSILISRNFLRLLSQVSLLHFGFIHSTTKPTCSKDTLEKLFCHIFYFKKIVLPVYYHNNAIKVNNLMKNDTIIHLTNNITTSNDVHFLTSMVSEIQLVKFVLKLLIPVHESFLFWTSIGFK